MRDETIKDKKYRKARCDSQPEIILPVPASLSELPKDYPRFLTEVKRVVVASRTKALVAASAEMTMMYWQIGKMILARQDKLKWGAKVIDRLSSDLKKSFPGMAGFSPRNLKYMRKFAEIWPNAEIVQRTVALVSWRTNISLMDKLGDEASRLWYAQEVLKNGWSKEWLDICIDSGLMERQGAEPSNFKKTLSLAKAEKVQTAFKDPYLFDFLGIDKKVRERELENALIAHVEEFLLELGQGFAFVGRQVHVEFEGDDFYLDLLFYHLKLRCFVVVELKVGEFDPGDAAQLNFYQTVINHTMKHPADAPTIGLLLVKNKNDTLVRYCLEGMKNPIGVSEWATTLEKTMPKEMRDVLPTIEQLESELADDGPAKTATKLKTRAVK
ncbi:MAG: DUF1016 family protein [Kiritimatiellae bacterium]|nr:DUF1016 family protein [Kiritimatiellia bacterium]